MGVPPNLVTFVVIDDSPEMCEALSRRLTPDLGVRCLGWAVHLADAAPLIEGARPDVAVLDLFFPEGDGAEIIGYLRERRPDLKVVMISGVVRQGCIERSLTLGAAGYMSKDIAPAEMARVIRRAAAGEMALGPVATAEYLRPTPAGVVLEPRLPHIPGRPTG